MRGRSAGDGVSKADHDAVDARRCDFGLVEGDEDDHGACGCQYSTSKRSHIEAITHLLETSDEAKDEIHGDAHAASLQSTSNQRHNGRDEDGALSARHISRFDARQAADEATGLEEPLMAPSSCVALERCRGGSRR